MMSVPNLEPARTNIKLREELAAKEDLIAELVEALEPFADIADTFNGPSTGLAAVDIELLRRARTAINKAKGT